MKKTFLALGLFVAGGATVFAGHSFFPDVSSNDWFYEGVEYSTTYGLMNGYENGNFGPNDAVNRAQLATILERMDAEKINNLYIELQAIRDHDVNQLMGSSWEEYVDSMRRFSTDGVMGTGEGILEHGIDLGVVATDKVNGVQVLTTDYKPISSDTTYFYLETSGMGARMFGPFYDNLERIIDEIEGLNTNLVD